MRIIMLPVLIILTLAIHGCVLTKIATVPMRVGGAVVSVVPLVGNPVHDGVDAVAETVDLVPL